MLDGHAFDLGKHRHSRLKAQEMCRCLGLRTSMRNQLACRVQALKGAPNALVVQVDLALSGGQVLSATVTRESADLLGLAPGCPVLALCKATAVKVEAVDPFRLLVGPSEGCCLTGAVSSVSEGDGLDEVCLELTGGGQWVGYAAHGTLQPGQPAEARLPASAVVVGWTD